MSKYQNQTEAERARFYRVQMHALSEEARVMKLSKEDISKRSAEIWDSAYGERSDA